MRSAVDFVQILVHSVTSDLTPMRSGDEIGSPWKTDQRAK